MADDVQQIPGGEYPGQVPDQGAIDQWIAEQQARLDAGLPLTQQGIPPGYKIENGKIVKQNWWDQWGKGATIGMGTAIAGGYGAGLLNDLMAAGGATGAGAGGVLPSTPIGTGAVQGLGNLGAVGGGVGAGAGAAAAAGGGGILDTLLKLAPVGAGLVGKLASGGFGGGNSGPGGQMSPELQQLLQLSMQRMQSQEPLFQAVTKQALGGLPTYAKS